MAKIINVDFKNKCLEGTFETVSQKEIDSMKALVYEELNAALDKIIYITENDTNFVRYCNTVFSGICSNLKHRKR